MISFNKFFKYKLSFKEYLQEIISQEHWKTDYKKWFYQNFNAEKYKKIISQLTSLFKQLNNGKLNKTIVYDLNLDKPVKLNSNDEKVIQILFDLGYTINKDMYKTGIALKGNKEKSIIDILSSYAKKDFNKMQDMYDKTKNKDIGKQLSAMQNLQAINILDKGKINLRALSIYGNKKQKIVFTYDHKAIASQSTDVGWTSCMNLKSGSYKARVPKGASDGVFIAYLVNPDDEFTLDNPVARVLFKPYEGHVTKRLYWKADKIYGTASVKFKTQAQKIINSIQGDVPKEQDVYSLTSNTYVDQLDDNINNITDQEMLIKIALEDENYRVRQIAVEKINDQNVLAKIASEDDNQDVREKALEKINDQKILVKIALEDEDYDNRKIATEKINDQNVLVKIALEDEDPDVRKTAIEKINDQKLLTKVALEDENSFVRERVIEKIDDQKILSKIALEDKYSIVRLKAVRKINDQKVLAKVALEDENYRVKQIAVEKINDQKVLAKVALEDKDDTVRETAVQKINDQKILIKVALEDEDDNVRVDAVENINDQKILIKIALEDESYFVRETAIRKIDDQEVLAKFALKDEDANVRVAAVRKINDQKVLAKVAKKDEDNMIRLTATKRLKKLGYK